MPTTPEPSQCPNCGTVLPPDSPKGLCVQCLLQVGLSLSPKHTGDSARVTEAAPAVGPGLASEPTPVISNYRILEKLGEGGCGIVYRADQLGPIRREVALKVIKWGMDTKAVIGRFEAERQALALMDHPNIAKVLDAGATGTGRPYFVMELVPGAKITDYCDQNHLSTPERLELFIKVCHAIQHAHQKGIIHRDIKPSNILVSVHDGVPVPKVIDFGIAKAIEGRLTERTIYTELQQLIGTPAYMSPEQAGLSGLDIDTRSDIYALGVLLYELLTGRTPFDPKELRAAGLEEMRRRIREQEPVRPSMRLTSMMAGELTTVAEARRSQPPRLVHIIRGDLDWIAMKTLEKDRTRRYETVNGLAMDIQRHLRNEPVVARPPGNWYRVQKLIRRNRFVVGAAAAVAVALLLGVAVSTWMYFQEREAHRQTLAAEQAAKAQASQLIEALRLWHSGAPGDLSRAEKFFRTALDTQKRVLGESALELAATLRDLSGVLKQQGRLPEAETALRQALAVQRKTLPDDNPVNAATLGNLGILLQDERKFEDAESTLRVAVAQFKRGTAPVPNLGVVLHHLAEVLFERKSLAEANALGQEAVDLYDDHPEWPAWERQHARDVLELIQAEQRKLAKASPDVPVQARAPRVDLQHVALLLKLGRLQEADQQLTQELNLAAVPSGDRVKALAMRAQARARQCRWKDAAADLSQVVEARPTEIDSWFVLAPFLILSGDIPAYEHACSEVLKRFSEAGEPIEAERAAKICLLHRWAMTPDELSRVARMPERAVDTGKDSQWYHWFELTEGLALFRLGDLPGTVKWMEQIQKHVSFAQDAARDMCEADSYLVLAMALEQEGQKPAAQAALEQGLKIVENKIRPESGDLGIPWLDASMTLIFAREAKETVQHAANPQLQTSRKQIGIPPSRNPAE